MSKVYYDNPSGGIRSPELVEQRIEEYQETLGLSRQDVERLIGRFENCLNYTKENVQRHKKFYGETFELTEKQVISKICNTPGLLAYTEDNVHKHLEFFAKLGLSKFDVRRAMQLLGYSEEKILDTIKLYQDCLGLSQSEVVLMAQNHMNTLCYEETDIVAKTKMLQELGFNGVDIAEKPRALSAPVNEVAPRYKIVSAYSDRDYFLRVCDSASQGLYARARHMDDIDVQSISYLEYSKPRFRKYYGVSVDELSDKYPLDEYSLETVEARYDMRNCRPQFKLSRSQINAVIAKSRLKPNTESNKIIE